MATEILKGKTEKLLVKPWENKGTTLVSVGVQFLDAQTGDYVFKKGGFALTPDEAVALAEALRSEAASIVAAGSQS